MNWYRYVLVFLYFWCSYTYAGDHEDLPLKVQEAIEKVEKDTVSGLELADEPELRSQIYGRLGMVYHAQSLFSMAERTYRSALREYDFVPWIYLLGIVLSEMGEFEQAIAVFDDLLRKEELPDVVSHLALFRVGRIHFAMGSVDLASTRLEAALLINRSAVVLSALADVAVAQGELSVAKRRLEQAAEIDPKAGQLSYKLALILRDLGDSEQAERKLKERNTIAPVIDDPLLLEVAQFNMSSRFFLEVAERAWRRDDRDEALMSYERAVVLDPDNLTTGLALVRAYDATNKREEAGALIGQYLEKYPEDSESWYLAGYIRRRDANNSGALVALDKALKLNLDSITLALRAGIYLRDRELSLALNDYETLVKKNAGNAYYRYMLGLTYIRSGDCPSALSEFDEVLRVEPQWGKAHLAAIRIQSLCATKDRKSLALDRARYLLTLQNDRDTRLTLAFATLGVGDRERSMELVQEDLDHPDARLLETAMKSDKMPNQPFSIQSEWWLARELL